MPHFSANTARVAKIAALLLVVGSSAAATIILTFINPCYATICSEEYFPFETRLHLIIFYGFLLVTSFVFTLRQYIPAFRSFFGFHILNEVPLVGKRITIGGVLFSVWVLAVVGTPTVFWWSAQNEFWGLRADPLGWASAKLLLTITGLTGHYADILLGLLIIPVSRNSLVGHAFSLHQSSLLLAHKIISYLFAMGATAHGVTYILYATDSSSEGDAAREEAFATGNPAMTLSESKVRSSWFTMTTYTGIAALLPIFLIVITSIPWIRRRHYNFFYYSHVLFGTIIFAASCIHASTDLYLLIPGLLLWFVDLFRRWFCGQTGGLSRRVAATIENADNGWVRISLPTSNSSEPVVEKPIESVTPLCYYYLNVPEVSKMQNHAFTAALPSSSQAGLSFLLQRATGKKQKTLDKEWTWKLGSLVSDPRASVNLKIRVEGPYAVNDAGFRTAAHIICIVGGTGITGALSLAHWWLQVPPYASRFTLVWTTRNRNTVMVKEWTELEEAARSLPNMNVVAHISSEAGRLDAQAALHQALVMDDCSYTQAAGEAWVYSSGPDSLLSSTQRACVKVESQIKANNKRKGTVGWSVQGLSWYMARWEV